MLTLLLVDDECLELQMLAQHVDWRSKGFELIATAANGRDALEQVRRLRPDVLITDIKMPIMDGIALARHVRALDPNTKIAFLSGYGEFSYAKSALDVGAAGYLLKPVNMDELNELLERIRAMCEKEDYEAQTGTVALSEAMRHVNAGGTARAMAQLKDQLSSQFEAGGGSYFFALITIDEFASLSRDLLGASELLDGIDAFILQLAQSNGLPICRVRDGRYVMLSREPLCGLIAQPHANNPSVSRWISICHSTKPIAIEDTPACILEMSDLRSRHVLLHGCGSIFASDEVMDETASDVRLPDISKLLQTLQQNDPEGVQHWVSLFFQAARDNHISRDGLLRQLLELIDLLYARLIAPRSDMAARLENKGRIYGKLSDIESMQYLETTLLQQLLNLCFALSMLKGNQQMDTIELVKKIIEHSYMQPLTIDTLAERAYLSPNYLRAVFKNMTGKTILEYITDVRMREATVLLSTTALRVHQISERIGYENASHFCSVFQKKYGVTPNQYRTQRKGGIS